MEKEKRREAEAVSIHLDKKRKLKYSRDSYIEILRNLQISRGNSALLVKRLRGLDLRCLSVFLWAGLSWEDPLLHLVKVENILVQYENNSDKLKELEKAIVDALEIAVKSLAHQSEN